MWLVLTVALSVRFLLFQIDINCLYIGQYSVNEALHAGIPTISLSRVSTNKCASATDLPRTVFLSKICYRFFFSLFDFFYSNTILYKSCDGQEKLNYVIINFSIMNSKNYLSFSIFVGIIIEANRK